MLHTYTPSPFCGSSLFLLLLGSNSCVLLMTTHVSLSRGFSSDQRRKSPFSTCPGRVLLTVLEQRFSRANERTGSFSVKPPPLGAPFLRDGFLQCCVTRATGKCVELLWCRCMIFSPSPLLSCGGITWTVGPDVAMSFLRDGSPFDKPCMFKCLGISLFWCPLEAFCVTNVVCRRFR